MLKVDRKFERRGPLYVPKYDVERPRPFERYKRRWQYPCAAITRVHLASSTTQTGNNLNLTISSTTSGNFLIVHAFNVGASSLSISDNKSGGSSSYTSLFNKSFLGVGIAQSWFTPNIASGITQVTVAGFNNNFYVVAVEYSGIATSSPLDQGSNTSWNVQGTPFSSGQVTTTQAAELLVGYVVSQTNPPTAGGSWTIPSSANVGYGSYYMAFMEQIVSSIQTNIAATGTASGSSNIGANILTFKAAAGGTNYNQSLSGSMALFS